MLEDCDSQQKRSCSVIWWCNQIFFYCQMAAEQLVYNLTCFVDVANKLCLVIVIIILKGIKLLDLLDNQLDLFQQNYY